MRVDGSLTDLADFIQYSFMNIRGNHSLVYDPTERGYGA
jgi:hypothetical protein